MYSLSIGSLINDRPEDAYLYPSPLLVKRMKELHLKRLLGREWGHLLILPKKDRRKAIESICTNLQETRAAVIDALREEHQSSKSYLSRLPLLIIENIQELLLTDMQTRLKELNEALRF